MDYDEIRSWYQAYRAYQAYENEADPETYNEMCKFKDWLLRGELDIILDQAEIKHYYVEQAENFYNEMGDACVNLPRT